MNPNVVEVKEENLKKKNRPTCNFCGRSQIDSLMFGSMYQLDGITVHYFCMLFSAGLSQNGEDDEGIWGFLPPDIQKEVDRGKKLKCKFCKKPHATVGCSVKKCKCSFHYTCGLENGHSFEFIDQYCAYCTIHKKKSEIKIPRADWECQICFDKDFDQESTSPLKPPCCDKNNAVFHRKCMMQMATSAGLHAFKCPLCNNKDEFSNSMRKQGIFVPDRDAAWELESGAYSELNQQYNRCDIVPCQCPQGRDYSSPEDGQRDWKLIRCGGCGAAGVHMKCGQLENFTYRCQASCKEILADLQDESEDEDELSQPGRRGLNTSRQGRINRSRFDPDSDEEQPVHHDIQSILDRIPMAESDEDMESDEDSSSVISKASTDKTEIVVPLEKKERHFGKLFKVMGDSRDSEDGSFELEDIDSEEEDDHGFAPIGNNISNEDNDESSSSSEVRTGLVEVERNSDKVLNIVSSCRTPVRPSSSKLRSEAFLPDLNAIIPNMENIDQETVENMVVSFRERLNSALRLTKPPSQKEEKKTEPILETKQSPKKSNEMNESIKSIKLATPVKNDPQPNSSKYSSTKKNSVHIGTTTQHEEDLEIIDEVPSSSSKTPSNKYSSSNITNLPSEKKIPTLQSKLDKWLSPPDDHETFPNSTTNFSVVRDLSPELNREVSQNNSHKDCSPNIPPPNIESDKNVPLIELSDDDDDLQIVMDNVKTPPKTKVEWEQLHHNYVPTISNPNPNFSLAKDYLYQLYQKNTRYQKKTGPDLLENTIILEGSDDENEYKQNKLQQQNSGEMVQVSKPNRDREPSNSKRLRSNAVDEENQSDETPTNKTPPKRPRVAKK